MKGLVIVKGVVVVELSNSFHGHHGWLEHVHM